MSVNMKYYSQIGQDKWVCEKLNFMPNGTWVDVGCQEPISINNTYAMETQLGWKGVSIDIDPVAIHKWRTSGRNTDLLIQADALKINYEDIFSQANLPEIIDYLSMDLEPPTLTLLALYKIPFDKYKFKCITYETDAYRNMGTEQPSRDYLASKGYVLIVPSQTQPCPQDDFWMHKDFI